MSSHSLALDAALRVLRGVFDLDAVRPAPGDAGPAHAIACASDEHPVTPPIAAPVRAAHRHARDKDASRCAGPIPTQRMP